MTSLELIKKLEPQIKYLSTSTKVRGLERDDIKQELILMVLEDVKKNPKFLEETYSEGWWFKRLKWILLNLREKEHREPVNRSIRFETLDGRKKNG